MGIIIRDYTGGIIGTGSGGYINEVSEKVSLKFVVHQLPAANKTILQSMGFKAKEYTIKGLAINSSGVSQLSSYFINHTGSILFSSQLGILINNMQVFYHDITFEDVAGRPLERKFTLSAIEVT